MDGHLHHGRDPSSAAIFHPSSAVRLLTMWPSPSASADRLLGNLLGILLQFVVAEIHI
jgi:hypothetical protein